MKLQLLLVQMILIVVYKSCSGLDGSQVYGAQNEHCKCDFSPNTSLIQNSSNSGEAGSTPMCPPWYTYKPYSCKVGNFLSSVVIFQMRTQQTWLQTFYCMTTSEENTTHRRDVVGGCLFSFDNRLQSSFYPLPCNVSKLNDYTCAGLHREGQLCGRCVEGYAPPVFSYSLGCVNCTDYHLNWLRYIGAVFGPLTIFCLLICVFHINAMSAYLYGFVFCCQILTMPTIIRMAQNTNGFKEAHTGTRFGEMFYVSLLSIWNLDILRGFYKPFCLHPRMTVVQALAIDYIIALYPLVLLMIAFLLVALHSRNFKVVVLLCKPFQSCLRPFIRNLNIQTSLIESFATLFLLSAMKVQSVTLDLLSPTSLHYVDGSTSENLYLYLAGDVVYFGKHHLLYALLALFFAMLFVIIPALLLFLYPCQFFQRFLNATHCNFLALRIFMDVFQGNFKDGTNGSRDYRFFSGIFFLMQFILAAIFFIVNSIYSILLFGTVITMLGLSVGILHPQRTRVHYVLDCTVLTLLSLLFFSLTGFFLGPHNSIASQISRYFGFLSLLLPLIYITCLVCYWTVAKKRMPQRLSSFLARKARRVCCARQDECQGLLVCTD